MSGVLENACAPPAKLPQPRRWVLDAECVSFLGQASKWFRAECEGDCVLLIPQAPLPARCVIRPAALFQQRRGFPELNTVMGRMLFQAGTTEPQRYTPFTRDPDRELRALYLQVEPNPDDNWPNSPTRWSNAADLARPLLAAAQIPWPGFGPAELGLLSGSGLWTEPLEALLLGALAAWSAGCGEAVIEIGSLRGQSLASLALGLRAAGSDLPLISIDPHDENPTHAEEVRLALTRLTEERRLVPFRCTSDRAWRLLRPGVASLIFLDGDHSHEQVVRDVANYTPLLAPGGCMVFHDYGYGSHNARPDLHPGVRRAVDEQILASPAFEPLFLGHLLLAVRKSDQS